jgi:hypothetical protein
MVVVMGRTGWVNCDWYVRMSENLQLLTPPCDSLDTETEVSLDKIQINTWVLQEMRLKLDTIKTGNTACQPLTMSEKKIQGHFSNNICQGIPWCSIQPWKSTPWCHITFNVKLYVNRNFLKAHICLDIH